MSDDMSKPKKKKKKGKEKKFPRGFKEYVDFILNRNSLDLGPPNDGNEYVEGEYPYENGFWVKKKDYPYDD